MKARFFAPAASLLTLGLFAPAASAAPLDVNTASEQALYDLVAQKNYTARGKRVNASYCREVAKKIVAGRPYRAVSDLLSRKIVSKTIYGTISKELTVAAAATPPAPGRPPAGAPATPPEPALPFPARVDHSAKQSPARDQGRRGTCIAFSTTAGIEKFDSRLDLSEQYAFYLMRESEWAKDTCLRTKYDPANPKLCQERGCYGTSLSTAVRQLQSRGLVAETDWPYVSTDRTEEGTNCHEVITWASKLPSLGAKKHVRLGNVEWLAFPGGFPKEKRVDDPMVLMAILAEGHAVNIAIGVAGTGWRSGTMIDVEIDPATNKPAAVRGGHGLLLVGYDYDKKAFKFKNSWGSTWGENGYGWFTFDYLKTYVTGGYYATGHRP
jgi:hypothetical protein